MSHTTSTRTRKVPLFAKPVHLSLIHNSDFSGDVDIVLVQEGRHDEDELARMEVDGDQFVELAMQVVIKHLGELQSRFDYETRNGKSTETLANKLAIAATVTTLEHYLSLPSE